MPAPASQPAPAPAQKSATPALDAFGMDLTERARRGELDAVIGRSSELTRALEVLCRRGKNNPIFVGEAGVGKTAIVEGLAQLITRGLVPPQLQDTRIISIDVSGMLAGTQYRGQFEERIKAILEEVQEAGNVVLFIDEIHTILGAGARRGEMDLANILKPALARGGVRLIGATTTEEYAKHFERDAALTRRFQPIDVREPTSAETLQILKGLIGKYEKHHKVVYHPDAIRSAVALAERYLPERKFPDKAIDVIDEAGALRRLQAASQSAAEVTETVLVSEPLIRRVVSMMSGTPMTLLSAAETERVLKLKERFQEAVIGQDEATDAVARAVLRSCAGLSDPNRPKGTFLFLGPSGVGKTLTAKVLAMELFGSEDALITIDMSEYMERENVSRLIGAPPGYIGHEEGGQLTEQVRRRPYSVILFDEIEKAHPDVLNTLLQLLEEGRLTDGRGRCVDFSNSIIIMTSNAGVHAASAPGFGFAQSAGSKTSRDNARIERVNSEIEAIFRAEFLNRVDARIVFNSIDRSTAQRILELELRKPAQRLQEAKGITLEVSTDAQELLLEKGFSEMYNARPLRRVVESMLMDPIIEDILREKFKRGDTVLVSRDGDSLRFHAVNGLARPRIVDVETAYQAA